MLISGHFFLLPSPTPTWGGGDLTNFFAISDHILKNFFRQKFLEDEKQEEEKKEEKKKMLP